MKPKEEKQLTFEKAPLSPNSVSRSRRENKGSFEESADIGPDPKEEMISPSPKFEVTSPQIGTLSQSSVPMLTDVSMTGLPLNSSSSKSYQKMISHVMQQ